jgi:hypothetical protein
MRCTNRPILYPVRRGCEASVTQHEPPIPLRDTAPALRPDAGVPKRSPQAVAPDDEQERSRDCSLTTRGGVPGASLQGALAPASRNAAVVRRLLKPLLRAGFRKKLQIGGGDVGSAPAGRRTLPTTRVAQLKCFRFHAKQQCAARFEHARVSSAASVTGLTTDALAARGSRSEARRGRAASTGAVWLGSVAGSRGCTGLIADDQNVKLRAHDARRPHGPPARGTRRSGRRGGTRRTRSARGPAASPEMGWGSGTLRASRGCSARAGRSFRAASVTKTVTAVALLGLADEGRLGAVELADSTRPLRVGRKFDEP